jgi:hypothetical protein
MQDSAWTIRISIIGIVCAACVPVVRGRSVDVVLSSGDGHEPDIQWAVVLCLGVLIERTRLSPGNEEIYSRVSE